MRVLRRRLTRSRPAQLGIDEVLQQSARTTGNGR